jgi:hypothetical protein
MTKLTHKLGLPILLLATMSFGASLTGVAFAFFPGERDMVDSRVYLHDVLNSLNKAPADFKGHRAAAITYATRALAEVDAGIREAEGH